MESGNTAMNLKSLGWKPLEERRLDNKLNILKKGILGKIDIPTDRLKLNPRQTRRGGGGPVYAREHSKIEAHRNFFFPSTTRLYNNLPVELRLCTDMDEFAKRLSKINLVELRNSLSSID